MLLRDAVRRSKGLQRVSFQSRQCHKINISCVRVRHHVLLPGPSESDHTGT
jgi:hypothetical protein